MKMTTHQIESLVRRVLGELEKKNLIQFNKTKEAVFQKGQQILLDDFAKETQLDREVLAMVDALEQKQDGPFDRHKMFRILKSKLAEERGVVL